MFEFENLLLELPISCHGLVYNHLLHTHSQTKQTMVIDEKKFVILLMWKLINEWKMIQKIPSSSQGLTVCFAFATE